jgi:hypothetical protein
MGAIAAGTSRDLNGEVYGSWTFTFDWAASRATGEDATAVVTYIDDTGAMGTTTATGPVIHGTDPTTYTGGENGGACFHAYGSGVGTL